MKKESGYPIVEAGAGYVASQSHTKPSNTPGFCPEILRGDKNGPISFMQLVLFNTGKLAFMVVILGLEVANSYQNRPV